MKIFIDCLVCTLHQALYFVRTSYAKLIRERVRCRRTVRRAANARQNNRGGQAGIAGSRGLLLQCLRIQGAWSCIHLTQVGQECLTIFSFETFLHLSDHMMNMLIQAPFISSTSNR